MPVYKDKKAKSYFCKFYYQDWQGKRHQKMKRGFSRAADAKKYERDFLNSLSRDCSITFENLCKQYVKDEKTRIKITTLQTNLNILKKWILPYFKETQINKITPLMVREWQGTLLSNDKLSQTYLRTINSRLSAVMNYAVKYYNLPFNPIRRAGTIGTKKSDILKLNFWTLDEFKKFLTGLTDPADESFRVAFITLFYTGLRRGELLALTPKDIDFKAQIIRVNKNYVQIPGQKIIQTPKTKKSNRIITIPSFLSDLLKDYVKRLYSDEQRIFFNLNQYSLTRKIKSTAIKVGVKPIRLHDLRHSHASLLIQLGFSPLVVADRLGHEDIKTTLEIYSHLYPEQKNEVAKKLDNFKV